VSGAARQECAGEGEIGGCSLGIACRLSGLSPSAPSVDLLGALRLERAAAVRFGRAGSKGRKGAERFVRQRKR
jgi:hypothetical protein